METKGNSNEKKVENDSALGVLFKSLAIAFSMYSKIPMPQFEWKKKYMRYALCFFPLVGVVIGLITWLWFIFCVNLHIQKLCFSCVGLVIPLAVTGGIHMDGYIDTMDALHSYADRERKLEILKDPHIGAFAVIMTVVWLLITLGAYSLIDSSCAIAVLCLGYCLSRILSGIAAVKFPCAKKEGTLFAFANSAHEKIVKVCLAIQLIVCIIAMLAISLKAGLLALAGVTATFIYYYINSKDKFGGITGDLAGWFVTVCETVITVSVAVSCI